MSRDLFWALSWSQPGYVTYEAAQPSTYTLIGLGYEQQWRSVQNKLAEYSLYQDNWDGQGSLAAPSSAFNVAVKLLKKARANSSAAPSTATLSPSGAIQLEWWSGQDVLQAEIVDQNRIEWVEFGPNKAPRHWSEDLSTYARGRNWEATSQPDQRVVVSASET